MAYLIYIFFGLAPSIIWLLFYLRKDVHPEPKRMVILVFLLGMAIAPLAALLECLPIGFDESGKLSCLLPKIFSKIFPPTFYLFFYFIFGVALIEEVTKYLVVRLKILKHPEFDEPVDVMLYMIIAALGFAGLENILVLFSGKSLLVFQEVFQKAVVISSARFIGATFLHALSSGVLGYFLALSFFETKKALKLTFLGIAIATFLHGFFNISIIGIEGSLMVQDGKLFINNFPLFISSLISVIIILSGLGLFVSFGFRKVKKIASVCKIK